MVYRVLRPTARPMARPTARPSEADLKPRWPGQQLRRGLPTRDAPSNRGAAGASTAVASRPAAGHSWRTGTYMRTARLGPEKNRFTCHLHFKLRPLTSCLKVFGVRARESGLLPGLHPVQSDLTVNKGSSNEPQRREGSLTACRRRPWPAARVA